MVKPANGRDVYAEIPAQFKHDCKKCQSLCCTALRIEWEGGFVKDQDVVCEDLTDDFTCRVWDKLESLGRALPELFLPQQRSRDVRSIGSCGNGLAANPRYQTRPIQRVSSRLCRTLQGYSWGESGDRARKASFAQQATVIPGVSRVGNQAQQGLVSCAGGYPGVTPTTKKGGTRRFRQVQTGRLTSGRRNASHEPKRGGSVVTARRSGC